jgi:hypothetical protein
MKEGSKRFFFEKKKQKTFAPLDRGDAPPGANPTLNNAFAIP